MSLMVMLAFSNTILSYSVAKLLEGEDGFDARAAGPDEISSALADGAPDVVLTDIMTLYRVFKGSVRPDGLKIILVDTGCNDTDMVNAVVDMKVRGVLAADTTPVQLRKAARAVAEGDIWLEMTSVKGLIEGIRNRRSVDAGDLSRREKEVISLVGTGCRNKEIASRLHISEATVKAHLNRIFHKLGVSNRSQLVSMTAAQPPVHGIF